MTNPYYIKSEIADHKMDNFRFSMHFDERFIHKKCVLEDFRNMSYGMSQRRFAESIKDMDKEIIELEGSSKDHNYLRHFVPWHKTKNEQQPTCDDLPSSSIDEAAITKYCKQFENEAATKSVMTQFYMYQR